MSEFQEPESFRDRMVTVDEEGRRKWIYPTQPKGKFYNYRTYLTWVYLIGFFSIPFLKIDGDPMFMINVLERKFIFFNVIFWPQDFFIFMLAMITFIVFIVLFTVAFGRVFCGWICPQTIFMEMVFRKIEYWIEGDANHQRKLSEKKWDKEKITKRGIKFFLFLILSFLIANTFLSYIIGSDELIKIITEPVSSHLGGFIAISIFTLAFFAVYSFAREQICTIVCPYGRLQGVMLDKNSIVVAYDYLRGEERGKLKKTETRTKGDCVDCGLCVRVCPTGIDIRNGTQLECINCTACIDACDSIMDQVGFDKGLIKYASENNISQKTKLTYTTRLKAYTFILVILLGVLTTLLITRKDIDTTVLRAQGQLYQEQPNNKISNLYTIQLLNKTHKDIPVQLQLEGINGEIKIIGNDILVKKESEGMGTFFITRKASDIKERKTKFKINVYSNGKKISKATSSFFGPVY
jgi:cytochrome c oxidase accessory protein FixG